MEGILTSHATPALCGETGGKESRHGRRDTEKAEAGEHAVVTTPRILCGWEFGAGLGHVTRLKPIVTALRDGGAEIVVALQDLDRASAFLDPQTGKALPGFNVVSGPRWEMPRNPEARKIPTHSFADVLNLIGYGNAAALAARVEAWSGLINAYKPDLVLGDFCPTLRLAARGQVPMIMVGNGYTIPPAGRALPPIRPWQSKLEAFSVEHEEKILKAINAVLSRRGEPTMDFLSNALNGDETCVFSIPLVDPYAAYREAPQLPPFNLPAGLRPRPLAERGNANVFFYMPSRQPELRKTIEGVTAAAASCEAYISDLGQRDAEALSSPSFKIHRAPQPFDEVIPRARLIVHHGGLSTAVAAIQAATPQLIVPWNLEHLVTARRVETLGAAVVVENDWTPKRIADAVKKMVRDKPLAIRAANAVDKIQLGAPEEALKHVVTRCNALMG
jgi:rhamnosyltransferase subunit B